MTVSIPDTDIEVEFTCVCTAILKKKKRKKKHAFFFLFIFIKHQSNFLQHSFLTYILPHILQLVHNMSMVSRKQNKADVLHIIQKAILHTFCFLLDTVIFPFYSYHKMTDINKDKFNHDDSVNYLDVGYTADFSK